MTEPLDPDDKAIYDALREAGAPENLAYTPVQRIRDVAVANLMVQFMAKLDAQNAKLDAISGAQESRLRMLIWMIAAAVALVGILDGLWV
ncbi:MAG: hypothetical protein OXN97_22200 [Bryobacterales bacterium]|nr:hypothetical protein [Bryobacterales bacterium]